MHDIVRRGPGMALGLFTLVALPGCVLPGLFGGGGVKQSAPLMEMAPNTVTTTSSLEHAEPVLYGRDGRPVSSNSGNKTQVGSPVHAVEGGDGSRMYLLELYQQAIDEKESLLREVEALNASQARMQSLLEDALGESATLKAMNADLKREIEQLAARTLELGSRLTTAQIGRLRSEKLLLEAKIHWEEVQQMIRGASASSSAKSAAGTSEAGASPADPAASGGAGQ